MTPYQAQFCDWLVDVVVQESIDCVLVAGDLYDRSNPKEDAVNLLDDVFHRLRATGASIVAISGNHDSAERLHFGTRFMAGSGLHIRTERRDLLTIANPVTVTGRDGNEVEILPLPYLDPHRVALAEGLTRDHESVLRAVIDNQRARLADPSRAIAMAHAFVTGGATSDSERALTIGGTGAVPADLFDGFGYVALGHLHRPQAISEGRLVYSGTPLSYSFSEQHAKSLRVIDVDTTGTSSKTLNIEVGRPVVTIEDTLETMLKSSKYEIHVGSFVRARLTDQNFHVGAMDRLRHRFPHVLELEQIAITGQSHLEIERLQQLAKRSEEDVVNEYVKETFEDGLDDFGRRFLDEALTHVLKGDSK